MPPPSQVRRRGGPPASESTAADAALVTLGFPALQSTNQATGDIGGTAVSMKIEVKTSSGPWVNVSTTDDPRAMDAVDASTVRMPASTLATRADIRVAFVDVAAPVALPFRIEYRTVGSGTWLTWAESAAVASSTPDAQERLRAFLEGKAGKVVKS